MAKWWMAAALVPLALAGCQTDPFPQGVCTLASVGDLHVLTSHGSPIIPVTLNGTPVAMTVDTGAGTSMLSGSIVDKLGLSRNMTNMLVSGVDGSAFASSTTIESLGVGGGQIHNIPLTVTPAPMSRTVDRLPLAGLFGGDFLYNYDVYFDMPDRQFSFYQEFHCPRGKDIDGSSFGWTNPYYELPFEEGISAYHDDQTKIHVQVELNGHKIDAVVDSGAYRTTISLDDAHAAGVTDEMLAQDRSGRISGIIGEGQKAWLHHFDTLFIGPEHFSHIPLVVSDMNGPTLLGADFLRPRRTLISYRRDKMLIELPMRPAPLSAMASGATGPAANAPVPIAPGQALPGHQQPVQTAPSPATPAQGAPAAAPR